MMEEGLNQRSWQLLNLIVERYIRDGQPVASKILAESLDLKLSPATIRNIMADLEELGYLASPHTSSGRIPTMQGYRLFVNHLLTSRTMTTCQIDKCEFELDQAQNREELLRKTSSLLSNTTRLAGLVTIPKHNQITLRHVEFLPLTENRVLVILVFNQQEVQNRIIYTDRVYSASELQEAANCINDQFAGKDLLLIRQHLLESMQSDKTMMTNLMQTTVDIANKTFHNEEQDEDYVMAGEVNLLGLVDTTGIDRLKKLFDAFTQKQVVLHLLDKCLNTDGVQIFIGAEAGYDLFEDFSIVTAPYKVENVVVGVLGVIGPTRMPYDHVISAVDVTARLLSTALKIS